MSQVKRTKARQSKTALSVLSLAGLSLAATTATTSKSVAGMPSPAAAPLQAFTLGEEEISDVTLATFHLFDKESVEQSRSLLHLTRCGCGGGCRGGGGGCRGCGGRGCADAAADADAAAVAAAVAVAAEVGAAAVCRGVVANPGAERQQRSLGNSFEWAGSIAMRPISRCMQSMRHEMVGSMGRRGQKPYRESAGAGYLAQDIPINI